MSFDFEKLFQAAPSPFVLLDRDLRMVWTNEAYRNVTGRTRESLIGRVMTEEFPSDPDSVHGRMLRASFKRVFASGATDHLPLIPYPIAGADGEIEERYWSATHTPIPGADGATEFVLQNTHDVTDLYRSQPEVGAPSAEHADLVRRAEVVTRQNLELDTATDFFQSVFHQAPTFMAILTGPDHVFRIVNRAYLKVVGERDLIGRPVREALPDIEGQGFYELLDQAFTTGEAVTLRGAAITVQRDSGTPSQELFLDFVYQPLFDAEGETTGIFVQGHDVTAQRIAETHLREAEERFRTMAQTMPAHVWTTGPEGGFEWVSDQLYAYSGRSVGDFDGAGRGDVLHSEDRARVRSEWRRALEAGQAYEAEARLRRADGVYRWHLVRATPICDAAGKLVRWVGTNVDIDDQKTGAEALADLNATLEDRVERRNRELEDVHARLRQSQKMEAIGNLSGGIAHDFNNLLQAITGSLTLALRDLPEASPARGRIDAAMRSVDRGAALSSQLLAFSRQQPLQPRALDLRDMLAGMAGILQSALGDGVEIVVEAGEDAWPAFADAANIENALLNLAVNARDAMEGRGRLRIAVANRSMTRADLAGDDEMAPGDYVELRVADTGPGIPAEVAEKVFDPFFTTKPVGKGTGLGLATVYGFARQSGGRVTIDSAPGEGTVVSLLLPRSRQAVAPDAPAQPDPLPRGRESLLLVEDDAEVREASAALLADLGYIVRTAPDPHAALSVVEDMGAPELVITDVVMPGALSSREMADRLRRDRPHLPVLFVTGYSRDAMLHDGRLEDAVQVLLKPFTQERLAAKVRELLDAAPRPATVAPEVAADVQAGLRVLLCEDDALIAMSMTEALHESGAEVRQAKTVAQALAHLQAESFDVLVTDLGLPDGSGEDLAIQARTLHPTLSLIFATGREHVAAAERLENSIVLRKPFGDDALHAALANLRPAVPVRPEPGMFGAAGSA